MSNGTVNKVILIGNLGRDPETRSLSNGGTVANFSIATSESRQNRKTGEKTEHTEWHRVALFGRLAEIARDYLTKGSSVYLEGSIRTRKWQDKNGQDRYTTEIHANNLQMLDSKTSNDRADSQNAPRDNLPPANDDPFTDVPF